MATFTKFENIFPTY